MFDPISHFPERPLRSVASLVHDGIQTVFQLMLLSLLLLGLGGLVYKAIGPEGWLPTAFAGIWNRHPGYAIGAIAVVLIWGTWAKRAFQRRPVIDNRGGDALVYACLALGAFFALRLIVTGKL